MPRKRQKLLIFIARLAIAVVGATLLYGMIRPGQDAIWQRLQEGGPLRVAIDPSFPPFDEVDAQGQVAGFDVDLARELGRRLDVPVSFIPIAFDGLADAVIAGRADVVISAFPLDERLSEDVRYSQPYFEAGLAWVTGADSVLTAPEQLNQALVATPWGGRGDAWARAQKLPRILRTETPDQALEAVLAGQAEAALVDGVSAALFERPGLVIHSPPLVSDPYVIVLPRQSPRLAQAVDERLAQMMADGAWRALADAYFPHPPPPPR